MSQAQQVRLLIERFSNKAQLLLYSTGKVYGIKGGLRFYYFDGSYIDLIGENILTGAKK